MTALPQAIHQFHSGSATGDAITNSMFFIRGILREAGFASEIFAEHVGEGLEGEVRPHHSYTGNANQVLLVHHSMGHNVEEWLLGLPDQKTLVYHNITPECFFSNEQTRHYIRLGHAQLKTLISHVRSAIAVSDYNLGDLPHSDFAKTEVIPLLFDTQRIISAPFSVDIARRRGELFRLLFVGRVLPHKCQDELIELCAHLKELSDTAFELVLVGCEDMPEYSHRLRHLVKKLGLQDHVRMVGKVTEADLFGWYRASDAFVCLSEHEGFGVPLVESMLFDLPVFAAASTAIPATLADAGVLLPHKNDLRQLAETLLYLRRNRSLRAMILGRQRHRAKAFRRDVLAKQLIRHLGYEDQVVLETFEPREPLRQHIQIEGPAETSYSLAIVNRCVAFAFEDRADYNVSVCLTEGPGDYVPRALELNRLPRLKKLSDKGREFAAPDIVLRNLYPPRVRDCDGHFSALCFAWEETAVPASWVADFNLRLDCIFAPSQFTKRALVDSGVRIPVFVYGHGADHVALAACYDHGLPRRKFRFLHISSFFPRKGPDVLLKAFAQAFEPDEDVELLIKTFSNPHHSVSEEIGDLRTAKGNQPLIRVIEGELSDEQISGLYDSSDCLVMPSRGEGFGLPLVEAFMHRKPVITTGFGGQTDFCNEDTAWLIPFRLRPAKSHLSEPGSLWAEPDSSALTDLLREVAYLPQAARAVKAEAGLELVRERLTWRQCVDKVDAGIRAVQSLGPVFPDDLKVAWISSWNTQCGIATYSQSLLSQAVLAECDVRIYSNKTQEPFLVEQDASRRCWVQDFNDPLQDELAEAILGDQPNVTVIQFNFGFFSVQALARLIRRFHESGIGIIIDFHSTADVEKPDLKTSLARITNELALCHRLLVHNVSDLDRFQDLGLVGNTTFFPHGVAPSISSNRKELRQSLGLPGDGPLIATFGFLLPHKGILELLGAFKILQRKIPEARLLLLNARHNDPLSASYERELDDFVEQENLLERIIRIHRFLPDDQIKVLLEASEITVFPYKETQESVSGAIRYALSANSAAVCTPVPIFADLLDTVFTTKTASPEAIADALETLLHDPLCYERQLERQRVWVRANTWKRCAERLRAVIQDCVVQDKLGQETNQSPRRAAPSCSVSLF